MADITHQVEVLRRASIAGRQMPTINGMVDTRPGEAMDTRVRDREGALSEDEQLGVVLVKSGIITIDQLGQALGRAKERGVNLARVLIEDKLLTEEQFVGTLAEQLGLEFVDLATYPVDPAAAALVSENLARRYLAMPIGWWEGRLIVAMADPSNVFAIDDIRTLTGAEVRQVVVTAEAVSCGDQQVLPQRQRGGACQRRGRGQQRAHGRRSRPPHEHQRGPRGRANRAPCQPAHHPGDHRPCI